MQRASMPSSIGLRYATGITRLSAAEGVAPRGVSDQLSDKPNFGQLYV